MCDTLKAKTNKQRKYWNKAARTWIEFVRSGKDYYAEYLTGPALKRVIGRVKEKKVLDLGCGEGRFSRFFARMGAKVTGIDISEELIKAAREEEGRRPLGIEYYVADAADLHMFDSEVFDIVYCHMALGDIADYEGAIAEVSRVLKVGGRFIIVMEHPCFSRRLLNREVIAGWKISLREDGSKEYHYYWVKDYFRRHSYRWEWKHDRLTSSFITIGFHRTLSDYINTLTKHGLVITKLDEPKPLKRGVKLHPPLEKHYRIPHALVIEATKIVLEEKT